MSPTNIENVINSALLQDDLLAEDDIRAVVGWISTRQTTGLPVRPRGATHCAIGEHEMQVVFALRTAGILEIRGRDGTAKTDRNISLGDLIFPGPNWPTETTPA